MIGKKAYEKMSPEKLSELIWSELKKTHNTEKLEVTLPWHFGITPDESSEPLTITFRWVKTHAINMAPLVRAGYSVVRTKYDRFEISDGGRAIAELERKVGDITPYMERIKRILYKTGTHELHSGRIITRDFEIYADGWTVIALERFLTAISLVSNLDILPPYTEVNWLRERT